jgi:hypothetical protein
LICSAWLILSLFLILRAILYFCLDYGIPYPSQTGEQLFLEKEIGLLSPSCVPNVAGKELF